DRLMEWKNGAGPRRAGVSSFGVGGTNVHVVMEEAAAVASGASRPRQLLTLSAKTESALEAAALNVAEFIRTHPTTNLADLAYTLQIGRRAFPHRRMALCSSAGGAQACLSSRDTKHVNGAHAKSTPRIVFMFPGQGSQRLNMGRGL